MTYTLRELLVDGLTFVDSPTGNSNSKYVPRICLHDFKQYGGKCKAIWTGNNPDHYAKKMKMNPKLLKSYQHLAVQELIEMLDGKAVMGEGKSRSIFYVSKGVKHAFSDYETFLNSGFTQSDIRHTKDFILSGMTEGESLPKNWQRLIITSLATTASSSASSIIDQIAGSRGVEGSYEEAVIEQQKIMREAINDSSLSSFYSYTNPIVHNHILIPISNPIPINPSSVGSLAPKEKGRTEAEHKAASMTMSRLHSIQSILKEKDDKAKLSLLIDCHGDSYEPSRDEFLSDKWEKIISDSASNNSFVSAKGSSYFPVLIHAMCLSTFQLGNTLGIIILCIPPLFYLF